jgi:putative hemolysin
MTWEYLLWLSAAALALLTSAVCNGAEIAAYTTNRVRLRIRAAMQPPDRSALLLQAELGRPGRLVATLMVLNNATTYVLAMAVPHLIGDVASSAWEQLVVDVVVITPLILVFSEMFPKQYFRLEADRLAYVFARPLWFFRSLLLWTGVLPLIELVAGVIERAAGLKREHEHIGDARMRISALLREGTSSGVMSESQVTLVDRALAIRSRAVDDEMVPWDRVVFIGVDWDRARAIRVAAAFDYAYFPVLDRAGKVAGVLRQIDLFLKPGATPSTLIAEPVRFPSGMSVREALAELTRRRAQFGVIERDGRPVGVVTIRELVEPLTGQLADW